MRVARDPDILIVAPGDDLEAVPERFREPLTPFVREVFADPAKRFLNLAQRCPSKQMARWFRAVANEGTWELQLLQYSIYSRAGFLWKTRQVRGALVGLCDDPANVEGLHFFAKVSRELHEFYKVVQFVLWKGFYRPGGVGGPGTHMPVWVSECDCDDTVVDPRSTYHMGHSSRGDVLIYTIDDRGGWLRPRTGEVVLLGSVAETLDWVFAELLAGREPRCPPRKRRTSRDT
jgi:hypothetical protein